MADPALAKLLHNALEVGRGMAQVAGATSMVSVTSILEAAYDSKIESNMIVTRVDAAMNWVRKNSLWPMPMGLACCAIELMATASARFDISRFGMEVMRFSPRQADVLIVSGTVTYKMALAVKRIWDQMPEPKWCVAMGACASSGGMYRSYAVLQGIDQLIPVDVYISGCPPRPEALIAGLMRLQEKVDAEHALLDQKRSLVQACATTDGHQPAPRL
jgi:NADH-quinone oxidoreductase subunit B